MLGKMARPTVSRRRLGADDGDRSGLQEVAQAGNIRLALACWPRPAGSCPAGIVVAAGQREGQLDDAVDYPPPHRQPGVGEYPQHRGVVPSVVALNAIRPRSRASDTRCSSSRVAMPRRCRSSGTAKAISALPSAPAGLVAGHSGQAVAQPGQQRPVIGTGRPAHALGLPVGGQSDSG